MGGVAQISGTATNVSITASTFTWIFGSDGTFYKTFTSGTGNIGSSSNTFNTAFVKATSAQYADLAEYYLSDAEYPPGTVVEFGGDQEITITSSNHTAKIAGVVTTNPAYVMNNQLTGQYPVAVALQGRVPTMVIGPFAKGDLIVSSDIPGIGQKLDLTRYNPGCIIGKSLENYDGVDPKLVEVVVGRN
jgi:hypothetical protein